MISDKAIDMIIRLRLMYFVLFPFSFYDNCCNYATGLNLRVPWILAKSTDRVDIFQYIKSHNFGSSHDLASAHEADNQNGSAAESAKSGISRVKRTVRYLGPDNDGSFLAARMLFTTINQKAKIITGLSEIWSLRLEELGSQLMPCNCRTFLAQRLEVIQNFRTMN